MVVDAKLINDANAILQEAHNHERINRDLDRALANDTNLESFATTMLTGVSPGSGFQATLSDWNKARADWQAQQTLFTTLERDVFNPLEKLRGQMPQKNYDDLMTAFGAGRHADAQSILDAHIAGSEDIRTVFSTKAGAPLTSDLRAAKDALDFHSRLSPAEQRITPATMESEEQALITTIETHRQSLVKSVQTSAEVSDLATYKKDLTDFIADPASLPQLDAEDLLRRARLKRGEIAFSLGFLRRLAPNMAVAAAAKKPAFNTAAAKATPHHTVIAVTRDPALQARFDALETDYEARKTNWAQRLKLTRDAIEQMDVMDKDLYEKLKGTGGTPGLEVQLKSLTKIDNIVEKSMKSFFRGRIESLPDLYTTRTTLQDKINKPFGTHRFSGHSTAASRDKKILKIENALRKGDVRGAQRTLNGMKRNFIVNMWLKFANKKQYLKYQQDLEFIKQSIAETKAAHKDLKKNQKDVKRSEGRTATALYKLARSPDIQAYIARHAPSDPNMLFLKKIMDGNLSVRQIRQHLTLNNTGTAGTNITLQNLNSSIDSLHDTVSDEVHETRKKIHTVQEQRTDIYTLHTSLRTLTRYELMKPHKGTAKDILEPLRAASTHMNDKDFGKLVAEAEEHKKKWSLDAKIQEKLDIVVDAHGKVKDFDAESFHGEIRPEDLLAVSRHGTARHLRHLAPGGVLAPLSSLFPKMADWGREATVNQGLSQLGSHFKDVNTKERKGTAQDWDEKKRKKRGPGAPKTNII